MVGGYLILYEFSCEDDKTVVEHINVYISQLGFASKEGYMRIHNFPLHGLHLCPVALLVHGLN
jgi:hypothetical protein